MINEPQGAFMYRSSTILNLSDSGFFHELLLTVLGSPSDFHCCRTPRCAYVLVVKTHSLGRFWPVSWTITQFWGPEVISTIHEPRGAFTCRSSTLPFLFILTHFVDYYSPFWGPKAISMVNEPLGALTCRSSTITVWADSSTFLGLLLRFGILE